MQSPTSDLLARFQTLVETVAKLRGPDGCPWDKEQTQKSLCQYAIEEAFELAEAIESGSPQDVREELGDFLFQVVLQAQVAHDEGLYHLGDVIQDLTDKLVRRHPHVFQNLHVSSLEEIWKNWEVIKKEEKARFQETASSDQKKPKSVFNYPKKLPALQAASKIGLKSGQWKFDWNNSAQVLEKVHEEVQELEAVLRERPEDSNKSLKHEIGDVLFSVAQLARHEGLDPEACLREANRRFEKRFNLVLKLSGLEKESFAALPDADKEKLWSQAKAQLAD